jgi:hypothetical protein
VGFKIRAFDGESNFCSELTLEAIDRAVPPTEIRAVIEQCRAWEQRQRKLNAFVTVLLVIAMNLYTHVSIGRVMAKMARGLRYVWPEPEYDVAHDAALCYRRYQLGPQPLVALFHRVCRPMATSQTRGAFLFGLRLMAIDGTVEDIPDTPENAAFFGRQHGSRGDAAFPQVQCMYLAECGTHAIVDAGFWPYHTGEHKGAFRMLRSVEPGMLVMWDRGLHAYDLIASVRQRGGHVLARLAANVKPTLLRRLADGSYLAHIYPSEYRRRKRGESLQVRIIEYKVTDPALPGYDEVHRLIMRPEPISACSIAPCVVVRWWA